MIDVIEKQSGHRRLITIEIFCDSISARGSVTDQSDGCFGF